MPVGQGEQQKLLQHRFLEGVQAIAPGQPGMDQIDLYLVSTTGSVADAIYTDLLNRPKGIGAFCLNLTTRDSEDKILRRLCDASEIKDRAGEAVRLLANFGILSRSARKLGSFGTIGWVDPSLLDPAQALASAEDHEAPPGENDDQSDGGQPDPPNLNNGDFQCQLLFVVRQCRPLEKTPGQ
jgi:hypothetical protein